MKRYKIKEDTGYKYYISVVDKDIIDSIDKKVLQYSKYENKDNKKHAEKLFYEHFNIRITNLIVYGDTSNVTSHLLSKFIDGTVIQHKLGYGITKDKNAYMCFGRKFEDNAEKRYGANYKYMSGHTIIHEDRMSSWNCLMEQLKNPKYVIVYKIFKEE